MKIDRPDPITRNGKIYTYWATVNKASVEVDGTKVTVKSRIAGVETVDFKSDDAIVEQPTHVSPDHTSSIFVCTGPASP
jgi:hypothetical protein